MTELLAARPVPPADAWVLVLCGLLAAGLCLPRRTWRWFGLVVTVVHELGHALAGLVVGRRVMTIRIEADHSGVTHSFGTGPSAAWSTFWGYPFPAVVGAVWAAAVGLGHWPVAAVVSALVLLGSMVVMRGALSWVVTTGSAALLLALVWADLAIGRWLMLAVGTALWVGALRVWWLLARRHVQGALSRRVQHEHPLGLPSDAVALARATGVPAMLWLLAFLAVILLSAAGIALAWAPQLLS